MKLIGLLRDERAQLSIMGIMTLLVSLIVMTSITPLMIQFSANASSELNNASQPMAAMIVGLIPLFMWLGMITSIVFYIRPLLVQGGGGGGQY